MARNQLDFRQKYVHETENGSSLIPAAGPPSSCFAGAGAAGAGAAAAEAATMDSETIFRPPVAKNASSTRDRSSRAFGTRGEDLVMAEASVVPMPPGQDTRKPRREWGNHVSREPLARLLCCLSVSVVLSLCSCLPLFLPFLCPWNLPLC